MIENYTIYIEFDKNVEEFGEDVGVRVTISDSPLSRFAVLKSEPSVQLRISMDLRGAVIGFISVKTFHFVFIAIVWSQVKVAEELHLLRKYLKYVFLSTCYAMSRRIRGRILPKVIEDAVTLGCIFASFTAG